MSMKDLVCLACNEGLVSSSLITNKMELKGGINLFVILGRCWEYLPLFCNQSLFLTGLDRSPYAIF